MSEVTSYPLIQQANQAYQEGDFEKAAKFFGEAAEALTSQGAEIDSAEMRNNQSVALLQSGNPQGALDAVFGTEKIFAAKGDVRRQGLAAGNEASALDALNRYDEAIKRYRECADLLEKAGEDQMRATVLQSQSWLYIRRGKLFEALFAMNDGLRGVKQPTLKQKILRAILKLRTW